MKQHTVQRSSFLGIFGDGPHVDSTNPCDTDGSCGQKKGTFRRKMAIREHRSLGHAIQKLKLETGTPEECTGIIVDGVNC